MMRAKIVDLNALMFSPNFDDESELSVLGSCVGHIFGSNYSSLINFAAVVK
jgi:hypothetical protein